VSSERTFAQDLDDKADLERELLRLSLSAGRALRKKGFRARTVTVKIRDADFKTRHAGRTLKHPVESDRVIFSTARDLLGELRTRRRTGVRLLGVGLSSLEMDPGIAQTELFQDGSLEEDQRAKNLSRVVDHLRNRFGDDAILPGRILDDET
jgi:DNA polymerase-4